jgi:hypothetical protein
MLFHFYRPGALVFLRVWQGTMNLVVLDLTN